MEAKELKRAVECARGYIGKIGRQQPHSPNGSVGKMTTLIISTEICYQERVGGTRYWGCNEFDVALAKIIRVQFSDLSKAALDLMEQEYKTARIAEKASLQAKLAEIEALEAET